MKNIIGIISLRLPDKIAHYYDDILLFQRRERGLRALDSFIPEHTARSREAGMRTRVCLPRPLSAPPHGPAATGRWKSTQVCENPALGTTKPKGGKKKRERERVEKNVQFFVVGSIIKKKARDSE